MEKEEILLGEEMDRLQIEPVKSTKRNNDNPFINVLQKKNLFKNSTVPANKSKCTCHVPKKVKTPGIYKNKHNKILKEPILKVLKHCSDNRVVLKAGEQESSSKSIPDLVKCDLLNLSTLVRNCNQLTISSSSNKQNLITQDVNGNHKWWRKEVTTLPETRDSKQHSSHTGSCSQQALNPPCDVTIDELASYFETLVHIPKKMSSMAEMMYI